MRYYFLDLDGTISRQSLGEEHGLLAKAEDVDEASVRANLRNPEWLSTFINERHAAGDKICIVTRQPDKDLIDLYLGVLLGDGWEGIISSIEWGNADEVIRRERERERLVQRPGKLTHIYSALVKLGLVDPKGKLTCSAEQIVLIDDDKANCVGAHFKGFSAVWAEIGSDRYVGHSEAVVAVSTTGGDAPRVALSDLLGAALHLNEFDDDEYSPALVVRDTDDDTFFGVVVEMGTGVAAGLGAVAPVGGSPPAVALPLRAGAFPPSALSLSLVGFFQAKAVLPVLESEASSSSFGSSLGSSFSVAAPLSDGNPGELRSSVSSAMSEEEEVTRFVP